MMPADICSRRLLIVEEIRGLRQPPTMMHQIKSNTLWRQQPCTFCHQIGRRSLRLEVGHG